MSSKGTSTFFHILEGAASTGAGIPNSIEAAPTAATDAVALFDTVVKKLHRRGDVKR